MSQPRIFILWNVDFLLSAPSVQSKKAFIASLINSAHVVELSEGEIKHSLFLTDRTIEISCFFWTIKKTMENKRKCKITKTKKMNQTHFY